MLTVDRNGDQHFNSENGLASMPEEHIGRFRNGRHNPDPCDMLSGPCACGAWHRQEEWPNEIQMAVFGSISDKKTICKRIPRW